VRSSGPTHYISGLVWVIHLKEGGIGIGMGRVTLQIDNVAVAVDDGSRQREERRVRRGEGRARA
jgi:hypothetical protein